MPLKSLSVKASFLAILTGFFRLHLFTSSEQHRVPKSVEFEPKHLAMFCIPTGAVIFRDSSLYIVVKIAKYHRKIK